MIAVPRKSPLSRLLVCLLYTSFAGRAEELCDSCGERLSKNPMRILDCKSPVCAEIAKGAPSILDYLCEDCAAHFTKVKELLTAAGAAFEVDDRIVRGLDYYSRTVFEFVVDGIGAVSYTHLDVYKRQALPGAA